MNFILTLQKLLCLPPSFCSHKSFIKHLAHLVAELEGKLCETSWAAIKVSEDNNLHWTLVQSATDPEDDPFSRMIWEVVEADRNSWGMIVNSFQELECDYVAALAALHKQAKAWCVGPVML